MKPVDIRNWTLTSALGAGRDAHWQALCDKQTGLHEEAISGGFFKTWVGQVEGLDQPLPKKWQNWDCRNNRLAELALNQDDFPVSVAKARERYGAARIAVFVGTSTSGVEETERAYREYLDSGAAALPAWFNYLSSQNIFSVADYVRQRLGLAGPCAAISTACSSSAKVFACAARALTTGLCDAAIVGGVDTLCLTTLCGFHALQLTSPDICRPADAKRKGLSIGEAGGFALLDCNGGNMPRLIGYGESSDAHHMSAPHPEGRGAHQAMQAALERAGLNAEDVDYINLHGTGTPQNDLVEAKAIDRVFGNTVPCSSTKGWTGHTLGAAGMTEAAISLLALSHQYMPASLNTVELDPAIGSNILLQGRQVPLRRVMSNSFGFGGSNCSLLFEAAT